MGIYCQVPPTKFLLDMGGSSVRKSCSCFVLLIDHRSLEVCVCLLRETRTVLFLGCPSLGFPPPRSSGHPKIIFECEVQRGCGVPRGWMGPGVTPSDFSTRFPFDVAPCGDNRLSIVDCGCVNVCVLSGRPEGRSLNCSNRCLNLSVLLLIPRCRLPVMSDVCVYGGGAFV